MSHAPRSQQIVWVALALALALGSLGAAFIVFEWREIRNNQLEAVALHARALEDLTARNIGATESILQSLRSGAEGAPTPLHLQRFTALLKDLLRGRPILRSLSLLDDQGRVIASSNPNNLGLQPTLPELGLPAAVMATVRNDRNNPKGARLGPIAAGRDLNDIGLMSGNDSQRLILPVIQPVETGTGLAYLVAVVDPSHFTWQFDRSLGSQSMRALLLRPDGRLIVASSGSAASPGTPLNQLEVLRAYGPNVDWGSGIGQGSTGQLVLSSFRVARPWSLLVVAEQDYEVFLGEIAFITQWGIGFVLTSWGVLALGTIALRRNLMRDEKLNLDLHEAHAATRASESRNLAILQSALDAIVTIDAKGRIIDFNTAAERMFGYSTQRTVGQTMQNLIIPPHLREAHRAGMTRYLAGGPAHVLNRRIEVEAMRSDGSTFPVELTIVPVRIENVEIFTATLRDISARRQAEHELAAARHRELEIGARIQKSLLVTPTPPQIEGLRISSHSQASQGIDGDFVEVIRIGPHFIDVITGDVMGKGLAAAMVGAATKMQFSRSIAELVTKAKNNNYLPGPAEIVTAVHQAMTPALQALDAFVTLCYLRIDMRHSRVIWVGCGHEETLHVPKTGPLRKLCNQHPPLGVVNQSVYLEDTCELALGDALFLYSDGVTDALRADGERVGHQRLFAAVEDRLRAHPTAAAALHSLRRDLLSDLGHLQDDVTMVVVQRLASPACQDALCVAAKDDPDANGRSYLNGPAGASERTDRPVASGAEPSTLGDCAIELPIRVQALREVRNFVNQQTAAAGFSEDQCAVLEVACVEAFTNITRHAEGLLEAAPVELVARTDASELIIELIHLGDAFCPAQTALEALDRDLGQYPEGGFGLEILRAASDQLEYLHHRGVNTVRLHKRRA